MGPVQAIAQSEQLARAGQAVRHVKSGGQDYVRATLNDVPVAIWGTPKVEVLVAIPLSEGAALDAFYLRLPFTFNGGDKHERVQGDTITVEGEQWRLASWHYSDGKPWRVGIDDLDSHLAHCRGFFLTRGVVSA